MARSRDFFCDFARGQMTAFARLRALSHFDLKQVCSIDGFSRNAKTTRRNLNAAVERIFTKQVRDFTAFSVDREHVEFMRGFCIGAIRDLTLRAKGHGSNQE